MAFGSWQDVIDVYQKVYLKTDMGEHAQKMLDIIPELREKIEPSLTPGTSHGSLFLENKTGNACIRIIYEGNAKFYISLEFYADKTVLQEDVINESDIFERVIEYQDKMNSENV